MSDHRMVVMLKPIKITIRQSLKETIQKNVFFGTFEIWFFGKKRLPQDLKFPPGNTLILITKLNFFGFFVFLEYLCCMTLSCEIDNISMRVQQRQIISCIFDMRFPVDLVVFSIDFCMKSIFNLSSLSISKRPGFNARCKYFKKDTHFLKWN